MLVVRYQGNRQQLHAALLLAGVALTGRQTGLILTSKDVTRVLGIEALACVKDDFLAKARGGTGADGIRWKPLSEKTIAYHRRHPGLNSKRKRATSAGRARRPLLSAAQDRLWRGVYAGCLRRGDDEATAAAKAWAVVKRAGGKTILGVYGKTQVEIGRDTGRLFASLSPGAADNILDPQPGNVRVGTNVQYAPHFHAARPLWPASLPSSWSKRLSAALVAALPVFLAQVLQYQQLHRPARP